MSLWLAAWNFENSLTVFSFSCESGFFLPPRLWSGHWHLGVSALPAPRSNKPDTQDNRPGIQAHKRLSVRQETLFPGHRQYRGLSRSLPERDSVISSVPTLRSPQIQPRPIRSSSCCFWYGRRLGSGKHRGLGSGSSQSRLIWGRGTESQPGGSLDSHVGYRGYASKSQCNNHKWHLKA